MTDFFLLARCVEVRHCTTDEDNIALYLCFHFSRVYPIDSISDGSIYF